MASQYQAADIVELVSRPHAERVERIDTTLTADHSSQDEPFENEAVESIDTGSTTAEAAAHGAPAPTQALSTAAPALNSTSSSPPPPRWRLLYQRVTKTYRLISFPDPVNIMIATCMLILFVYVWQTYQKKDHQLLEEDHKLSIWNAEKEFRDDCRSQNVSTHQRQSISVTNWGP